LDIAATSGYKTEDVIDRINYHRLQGNQVAYSIQLFRQDEGLKQTAQRLFEDYKNTPGMTKKQLKKEIADVTGIYSAKKAGGLGNDLTYSALKAIEAEIA